MVLKGHFTRIDIADLKSLTYKKIGHERSDHYFNLLNRYFSSKISKREFNKLCIRTVGRENLSLHNKLIHSIVKNASLSKVPPPKVVKLPNDPSNFNFTNGYCKKTRSLVHRDCKVRDRPSPLGPLGKTRSPTVDQSPTELNSQRSGSKPRVVSVEDGEEVEQFTTNSCVNIRKSPILAPLGVSLNFGGGSRKKSKINSVTCQSSIELPDNMTLQGRIEQMLLKNGVGVSSDCVNLLNNGLNVFLKTLIEPSMGLARSRFDHMQRTIPSISLLDFRVSMESNPQVLGEDWPIQLEKVCSRAYEE